MSETIDTLNFSLPSDFISDIDLMNFSLIDSNYNSSYVMYFSFNENSLHKIGLKLIKHPNSRRLERKYNLILDSIEDKDLAKKHDDNIQLRREAVDMLRRTRKLKLKSDVGPVLISALGAAGVFMLTVPVLEIGLICTTPAIYLLLESLSSQASFNKAIKAIIKDYKKSLINNKIHDTVINLEYEYPKSEIKKLDKVRVLANTT